MSLKPIALSILVLAFSGPPAGGDPGLAFPGQGQSLYDALRCLSEELHGAIVSQKRDGAGCAVDLLRDIVARAEAILQWDLSARATQALVECLVADGEIGLALDLLSSQCPPGPHKPLCLFPADWNLPVLLESAGRYDLAVARYLEVGGGEGNRIHRRLFDLYDRAGRLEDLLAIAREADRPFAEALRSHPLLWRSATPTEMGNTGFPEVSPLGATVGRLVRIRQLETGEHWDHLMQVLESFPPEPVSGPCKWRVEWSAPLPVPVRPPAIRVPRTLDSGSASCFQNRRILRKYEWREAARTAARHPDAMAGRLRARIVTQPWEELPPGIRLAAGVIGLPEAMAALRRAAHEPTFDIVARLVREEWYQRGETDRILSVFGPAKFACCIDELVWNGQLPFPEIPQNPRLPDWCRYRPEARTFECGFGAPRDVSMQELR